MLKNEDVGRLFCHADQSLREILRIINENTSGIALLVDDEKRLVRAITDGDIRRAILNGAAIDDTVESLGSVLEGRDPTVATTADSPATMRQLMLRDKINQLPIVDHRYHVVGLVLLNDLLLGEAPPVNAVVMAGGFGTRLRPLTEDLPKPMLKVGDQPLLERIIGQLSTAGINNVSVTTHYLPEVIRQHFGDGHEFGVKMNYVHEEAPLGTAGALRLIERPDGPLVVMNGDILTNIDFRSMHAFHAENEAELTVAVRPYEVYIPYGVVESTGPLLDRVVEKPTYQYFVNAGIYLLSPSAFDYLGDDGRLDMTDLVDLMVKNGRPVANFPIAEYWLDIGQISDYERAQRDVAQGLL